MKDFTCEAVPHHHQVAQCASVVTLKPATLHEPDMICFTPKLTDVKRTRTTERLELGDLCNATQAVKHERLPPIVGQSKSSILVEPSGAVRHRVAKASFSPAQR